jgi:hypothetical protein
LRGLPAEERRPVRQFDSELLLDSGSIEPGRLHRTLVHGKFSSKFLEGVMSPPGIQEAGDLGHPTDTNAGA